MNNIFSYIKEKKAFFIFGLGIVIFILARLILLQKPNTELTYTVKQENLIDTVQVSGTYTSASQTQVTAPANGIITELYVNNGQDVKKGDPLFHVDSTATADQQKTAYANYTTALSSLQTAQNTQQALDATMWTKQKTYLDAQNNENYKNENKDTANPNNGKLYSNLEKLSIDSALTQAQKDFEAAEQTYKTANIAVDASQAQVSNTFQAYQETQNATVTSPANGTVVNLLTNIGDQVTAPLPITATTTTVSQQPVLVIANLGNPYISANISEDYAARVSSGQPATIVFDALKNQTFSGVIAEIATVGTTTQGVVSYSARISADNIPTTHIKPNMTALITIVTLLKEKVLDVPNSAIVNNNGSPYVLEAKTHKHIPVNLGTKGVSKTEITSGLSEGAHIVANPE